MFELDKFSLIILTRCNLRCRLCCEFVPQNKPFPDMTPDEERRILDAFFQVSDHVGTLHLTGGGEPFLHPKLAEMIDLAMEYEQKFDKLMVFTNSTVPVSDTLLETMKRHQGKIFVQVSHYHQRPEQEEEVLRKIQENNIPHRLRKYYGEEQTFGGWVDYGSWDGYGRTPQELEKIYRACFVTSAMRGNWRTRDGKVHWCSRSQRGMELGLIPDNPEDYVDLFDTSESPEQKREKFARIKNARFISACDHCSGDSITDDPGNRHPAAEQIEKSTE